MKNYINLLIVWGTILLFSPFTANSQWVETNEDGGAGSFLVKGDSLFAGVNCGGINLTTDNGTNWTHVNVGSNEDDCFGALAVSGSNIFAGTDYSLYLSTNNGTNWTRLNIGLDTPFVSALAVSGANIFAGTSGHGILLSTNNGTSWTTVNNGLTNNYISSLAVSGSYLFTGAENNIFRSSNNGTTWDRLNLNLQNDDVRAIAVSGTNVFAGTMKEGVFRSTNNGTNWTNIGLLGNYFIDIALSGTNIFVAHSGVFLSTNNGTNWIAVSVLNFEAEKLVVSGGMLFASAYNGFSMTSTIWRRSISEIITSAVSPNEQPSFILEQNHPNPFTTSTMISFTLPERAAATLDVFDMLGRKIRTLAGGMMDAGSHSVQFDAGELPVGVYTARLTANGIGREMKIIKITN